MIELNFTIEDDELEAALQEMIDDPEAECETIEDAILSILEFYFFGDEPGDEDETPEGEEGETDEDETTKEE